MGDGIQKFEQLDDETVLKPGQVLWDVAGNTLAERAPLTGEEITRDAIYREVNRIMVNSGFPDAHLERKHHISDRDLPRAWNGITNHTPLVVYTDKDKEYFEDVIRHREGDDEKPPESPPVPVDPAEKEEPPKDKPTEQKPPDTENPPGPQTPPDIQSPSGTQKPPVRETPPETQSPPEAQKPPTQQPPEQVPPPQAPPAADQSESVRLGVVAAYLRAQHDRTSAGFISTRDGQGFIGKAYDDLKSSLPFMRDASSEAIGGRLNSEEENLKALEAAAQAGDTGKFSDLYKQLTGHDFDPKAAGADLLRTANADREYDHSQHDGVDTITDFAAALAATGALRLGRNAASLSRALTLTMGGGAILGAGTKAGLKQIDGHYANLRDDLASGGIAGASVPLGEFAGAAVSRSLASRYGLRLTGDYLATRLETQGAGLGYRAFSAAAKSGTAGGVFGFSDGALRTAYNDWQHDQPLSAARILENAFKSGAAGFVGGTLLGMTFDGIGDGFKRRSAGALERPPAKTVNGVDVSESGFAGIDDAARMMGQDPGDFAGKAATSPYDAAADAAKLFEEHGVNIRKVTGDGTPALPEAFNEALNIVQAVDSKTPNVGTSLTEKIPLVKEAHEFVDSQGASAVTDSINKIRGDQNYQRVIAQIESERGAAAARQLEQHFESGLRRDITVGTAVERVRNPQGSLSDAFSHAQQSTEAQYLQKAADFFHDMTDPAQRARLNELVDQIFDKFNPRPISRGQLGEIVESFPVEDQPLALAILERSAPNTSDVAIRTRMQSLYSDLTHIVGSDATQNVYTLAPDSSGNLLGYLFRKSNSRSMAINNIDALAARVASGDVPNSVVLFDDLSHTAISAQQRELLAKIPNVYVVDLSAFEKGISVVDTAAGPAAVAAKLRTLVDEAKRVTGQHTGLIPTGAAKAILDDSVDEVAASLGSNVRVIRPSGNLHAANMPTNDQLAAMSPLDAIYARMSVPKASKEEIAAFLSGYAGADRELAAQMLSEGAVHNSFPAIITKAQQVNREIDRILSAAGAKRSDLLIVSDKDPGGSTHLVSYLYGRAVGLSPENFISSRSLDRLITTGGARGKVVAYMDDTIYSGSQTHHMLESNITNFSPFRKVIVGSIGAYETGLERLSTTHLMKVGKAEVATFDRYHPFYSADHPFYSRLDPSARARVQSIGGYNGYGNVQGAQIWSYMYPDNNLTFFGERFAGGVLHLPGP